MNKAKLTRFIQKYSLGGLVESVAWKAGDNKLVTRFISDDKTVLGEIQLDNFAFTSPDLGVYTTSALSKLLSVVGEDIELETQEIEGKAVNIFVKSENNKSSISIGGFGSYSKCTRFRKNFLSLILISISMVRLLINLSKLKTH